MSDSSRKPLLVRFSENLKKFRLSRGFVTAKDFALELGIKENTYGRYENGGGSPTLDFFSAFTEKYGGLALEALLTDGAISGIDIQPAQQTTISQKLNLIKELADQISHQVPSEETSVPSQPPQASQHRLSA